MLNAYHLIPGADCPDEECWGQDDILDIQENTLSRGCVVSHCQHQLPHFQLNSSRYFLLPRYGDCHPFPIDMLAPIWLLHSSCTACNASTHHLTTGMSSAVSLRPNVDVPFRYCSTRLSFPQLSSSGFLTLIVRKATRVCMSLLALADKKSNWASV